MQQPSMQSPKRRRIAVIGDGEVPADHPYYHLAQALGRLLADRNHIVVTGGLAGIMEAAPRGAHDSAHYTPGSTLGILPTSQPQHANQWIDIPIPTSLSHARNTIVAQSDAVIAIGGGAGTLSEICFAWINRRLIIALDTRAHSNHIGWSNLLLDHPLDHRTRFPDIPNDRIYAATTPDHAAQLLDQHLPRYLAHPSN